jgi:hypothetical protein
MEGGYCWFRLCPISGFVAVIPITKLYALWLQKILQHCYTNNRIKTYFGRLDVFQDCSLDLQ